MRQTTFQKMAGTFSETTSESPSFSSSCLPLTTVIDQWEVEYAKFVNFPPLSTFSLLSPPHRSLTPHTALYRNRLPSRHGAWLQSAHSSVFVKLIPGGLNHSDDAILMVYHCYKLLEQHHVSRLHFSWPQVTCISGFPARGTRTVFMSYKDCGNSDQIQKFAFRFSATHEAEMFISALKETVEDTRPKVSNDKFGSGISSQQEFDPSNCPSYKSIDESWRSELSLESSSHYIPTATDHEVAQASNDQGLISSNVAEEMISTFPPSFTSFLTNCCPTAAQVDEVDNIGETNPTRLEEVDFKNQLMKYIKDPSFQDILTKTELSLDSSSYYIPTTTDHEAAQASNDQGLILSNEAEEIISTFPPSFTSFLMNCGPTAEQGATKPTNPEEVDFKKQLMKYMKDPSFQDMLTKAEKLITELGDGVQFP